MRLYESFFSAELALSFLLQNNQSASVVFLHGNERRYVTTADGAGLLRLDQLLAAILAHTEVTAGHDESVFGVGKADETLGIWVIVFDRLLAFFSLVVVRRHTVDRFKLERKAVDKCNLFRHVDSIDILISIFGESTVGHHGVLSALVLVIH